MCSFVYETFETADYLGVERMLRREGADVECRVV
jgi:hypothetical protein